MSEFEIVGPFEGSYRVVVDGRQVPFLEARPANGGVIRLTLDDRYGVDVGVAQADALIPWIADAIAIGMGWNCHPRRGCEAVRRSPFPYLTGIDGVVAEPAAGGIQGDDR